MSGAPQEPILTVRFEPGSPEVPDDLWRISDPPAQLWVRGRLSAFKLLERLPQDGLAVVGTRAPQPRSRVALRGWIEDLGGSQLIILSGFARGIDAIAHETALRVGLPTVAIMATGLDRIYPAEHAPLAAAILNGGGLLVSEGDLRESGRPHRFLQRNRIIAGWSRATWVVEAPARSGALNTARWARDQNRLCFAVPAYPGDPAMAGNETLLDRDNALPFWGGHSLGFAWLRLATLRPPATSRAPPSAPRTDEDVVVALTRSLTFETGGAPLEPLLGATLEEAWEPGRFFLALRSAVKSGRLREESGVFIPNEAGSGKLGL